MISYESSACPATSSELRPAGAAPVKHLRRALRGSRKRGFTLVEVLVATAVTLLMMISLAQIFKIIGDSMQQGRSVLELNNRLRSVVYRLRSDLDNLTVIPAPPADPSTGSGYLQVFDGSTTDFTAATKLTPLGGASRFGDVDDIFMATVRAGDVWFTGKVPAYILAKRAPVRTERDDFTMVAIASQHAEVAVFLQPLVTNNGNPNRDPGFFLNSPLGAVDFEDTDSFPFFPDSFRLHYRILPIRPDLNLVANSTNISDFSCVAPAGTLPGGIMDKSISRSGLDEVWTASKPPASSPANFYPSLPSPLCDMALAHQQCDLSMRRVFDSGNNTVDLLAANSLEDLADPANRFAHVQVPIPGTVSSTMPVLALGASLPINASDPSGTFQVGSGFLHPAFVLLGDRAGEDLLASDVLAFDIRLFDPDVPLLGGPGGDGVFGTTSTPGAVGWAGSDDLILSPNDPGYAVELIKTPLQLVGTGEYVDLAWAKKLVDHGGSIPNSSVLSLLSGFSTPTTFSSSIFKSGGVLFAAGNPQLLQPTYDTYTTRYEGDGVLQAQLNGRLGVCRINGALSLYPGFSGDDRSNIAEAWRTSADITTTDIGTDGIDNFGSSTGVDDPSELETSAPFPIALRGLKISVRMEDPTTRQVKQMTATKEFVSQ